MITQLYIFDLYTILQMYLSATETASLHDHNLVLNFYLM